MEGPDFLIFGMNTFQLLFIFNQYIRAKYNLLSLLCIALYWSWQSSLQSFHIIAYNIWTNMIYTFIHFSLAVIFLNHIYS